MQLKLIINTKWQEKAALEWDFLKTPDSKVQDVIFGLKGFIFILFVYCSVLYFCFCDCANGKNDVFTEQRRMSLIFMDPSSY